MWNEYPIISTGNPKTTVDPYNSALQNNAALNPLGAIFTIPPPVGIGNGIGSFLTIKYVRYNSTANPAVVAGPAPVYYTDQTFTIVSGVSTEGFAGLNSVAGLLLPNSTDISGFTNTQLNGNYVWIAICGWVSGCIAPASTAAGDAIIAAAGNFTPARVAANTAPTNKLIGWATSAIASSLCNILCQGISC